MFNVRLVFSVVLAIFSANVLALPKCTSGTVTIRISPSDQPLLRPDTHAFSEWIGSEERDCDLDERYYDKNRCYAWDDLGNMLPGGCLANPGKQSRKEGNKEPKQPETPKQPKQPEAQKRCYSMSGVKDPFNSIQAACAQVGSTSWTRSGNIFKCITGSSSYQVLYTCEGRPPDEPEQPKEPKQPDKKPDEPKQPDDKKPKDDDGNKNDKDNGGGKDGNNPNGKGQGDKGDGSGKGDGKGNGTGDGGFSAYCAKHPDALACMRTGTPPQSDNDNYTPPTVERRADFRPDNFLGGGGGAVCPAPVSFQTRFGNLSFSWDYVCQILAKMRGMVIILFVVAAGMIIWKGAK